MKRSITAIQEVDLDARNVKIKVDVPANATINNLPILTSANSLVFAAVDTVPNANAGLITGTTLQLEPASAAFPGIVSTATQSFAGDKTFTGNEIVNGNFTLGGNFAMAITTPTGTAGVITSPLGPRLHGGGNAATGNNTFLGGGAGNLTGTFTGATDTGLGSHTGQSLTTGVDDTFVGSFAGANATTANTCVAVGSIAAAGLISAVNQVIVGAGANGGNQNAVTAVGQGAGSVPPTGPNNLFLGANAGSAGVGTNTCLIAHNGVAADSNLIRLGNIVHTSTFIAGISGVTVAGAVPAVISASGQLGTVVSSERFKTDIMDITPEKVKSFLQVKPKKFTYKLDKTKEVQYGFIAEQMQVDNADLVNFEAQRDGNGEVILDKDQNILFTNIPYTVYYDKCWPILHAAVQQLSDRVTTLEAKKV